MDKKYLVKSEICDEMGFEKFETMYAESFKDALNVFCDKVNKIKYEKNDLEYEVNEVDKKNRIADFEIEFKASPEHYHIYIEEL